MGTIIRTEGMIENPKYLYNGYTLSFDKTKWTNNLILYIGFNPLRVSQGKFYTIKSYGDQLMYITDIPVTDGELSYIGDMPVYTYSRPYGLDGALWNQYHIAENTARVDIVYEAPEDISFSISNRVNPSAAYDPDYVKTSFEQIAFHHSKIYWTAYISYVNAYIDFDNTDIDENLNAVYVSGNKFAKGNIANFAKAGNALTALAFYNTDMYGRLEDFADGAARVINTAKTIIVSGYLSKIVYQGGYLANANYNIAFDGNGGYTITTL